MIKPMFGHRAKYKKFDYPFRYYDPKEDERRKRRIKIEPVNRRRDNQLRRIILYTGLLAFVIWIMTIL